MTPSTKPADNYVRDGLALFANHGDLEAMVATDGRRFSYAQVADRVRDTAAALWGHGIRPGMTIAMLCTNSAEAVFTHLAAHLIGCRTAYMMHVAPLPYLEGVFGFVEADAFVYQLEHTGATGEKLARGAAAALPIFCLGAGGAGPDLTDPPRVTELPFDPADITHEPESLFQTSGTTGTPKLVRHRQGFFPAVTRIAAEYYRPGEGRIRHITLSGIWHAGGMSAVIMTLFSGGLLVMQSGLDIEPFLAAIAAERLTSTNMSPPGLYMLLEDKRLADADLSSLHRFTVSGTAASPTRLGEATGPFGAALDVVYGMSEIPMITALTGLYQLDDPELLASCGQPWGDVRVEIRDQSGKAVPAGHPGEIWVSGALVMSGYWNMPELTAETLVDGWLATGDVGRVDEDGNLYILDRVKDMVVTDSGGTMAYCRPIEDALTSHPDVLQASVVGVPDDFLGEAVHAYVIRREHATVTGDELRGYVLGRLNADWCPREVEFLDSFPLTEYGKVDKKQLRARYRPGTDATVTAGS